MDFITGPGSANKEQAEKSCISLITILFSPQVYIILQTAPVFNAYAQINLLSGKGKTDRKSRTANNGNFTEATVAEINHDLVCAFTEVSAVDKPNLQF